MRTCLVSLLILIFAGATHAHIGDVIYPFYELLDQDLSRIDLTDGSVEDWLEVRRRAIAHRHRLRLGEAIRSIGVRSLGGGFPHLARLAPRQRYPLGGHGARR